MSNHILIPYSEATVEKLEEIGLSEYEARFHNPEKIRKSMKAIYIDKDESTYLCILNTSYGELVHDVDLVISLFMLATTQDEFTILVREALGLNE